MCYIESVELYSMNGSGTRKVTFWELDRDQRRTGQGSLILPITTDFGIVPGDVIPLKTLQKAAIMTADA